MDEGRELRQQRTLAELFCVTIKSNDKAGVHILEVARAADQDSFSSTKPIDEVRDATLSKLQLIY